MLRGLGRGKEDIKESNKNKKWQIPMVGCLEELLGQGGGGRTEGPERGEKKGF